MSRNLSVINTFLIEMSSSLSCFVFCFKKLKTSVGQWSVNFLTPKINMTLVYHFSPTPFHMQVCQSTVHQIPASKKVVVKKEKQILSSLYVFKTSQMDLGHFISGD